jgi:hypothetical protein
VCSPAIPIAADAQHVFFAGSFANDPTGGIWEVGHDGSQPTRLATSTGAATALAYDGVSLAWVDPGPAACTQAQGSVAAVRVAGGTPSTLASPLTGAGGVALDSGDVYFSESETSCDGTSSSTAKLERVAMGGGAASTVASVEGVEQIAVTAERVYWLTTLSFDDGLHHLGSVAK